MMADGTAPHLGGSNLSDDHGDLKRALNPYPAEQPAVDDSSPERMCEFCELPISGDPPVLLKSGHSVHLDCYLKMGKLPPNRRPN